MARELHHKTNAPDRNLNVTGNNRYITETDRHR
jgi:hypothetical protein